MQIHKPELLSPAGSSESLHAAVEAGADAVYAAGTRFGARAFAENLNEAEITEAIDYVHLHGRKIYLTVNTLFKEQEMGELFNYLLPYYKQGLDAVIVQDVGVFSFLQRQFPDLPIHISTQAAITGADGASFFIRHGARRIILARELSLSEIRNIKGCLDRQCGGQPPQLECFVHGALCYCYSGQCLLSSMIGGRSGNRGQCAGPCRLPYQVSGSGPAGQTQKEQTLLSLKDLCTISHLPELVDAGIDAFKIEGRMKQPDYVYTVTSLYRKYLDLYFAQKESGRPSFDYHVLQEDLKTLTKAYRRRGYTDGYYFRQNGREMISFDRPDIGQSAKDTGEELIQNKQKTETHLQEKVNGILMLSAGSRAKLYLECGDISVTFEGVVVQKAIRQPLKPDQADRQIRKTGGTAFVFENLEVLMDDNVFLPVQDLNALRRDALALLSDRMTDKFHRPAVSRIKPCVPVPQTDAATLRLAVCVQTIPQFEAAVSSPAICRIYVDAAAPVSFKMCAHARDMGKEVYLAMPYIFREETRKTFSSMYPSIVSGYDGVLLRNWDESAWLIAQGYTGPLVSDQNLYVWNRESIGFFRQAGIMSWTAPAELNARELDDLPIKGQTLPVYGYQPVMVTANCIRKTTHKCQKQKEGHRMKLKDRENYRFNVSCVCPYCYNVIYNAVPLMLLDQVTEIQNLEPGFIRLDFTAESKAETADIIKNFADRFLTEKAAAPKELPQDKLPASDFTRGHFKRGVI